MTFILLVIAVITVAVVLNILSHAKKLDITLRMILDRLDDIAGRIELARVEQRRPAVLPQDPDAAAQLVAPPPAPTESAVTPPAEAIPATPEPSPEPDAPRLPDYSPEAAAFAQTPSGAEPDGATLEPPPDPGDSSEAASPASSVPPSQPPADVGNNFGDLEKRFGTQWVVWVGGVALALGGIFLIRYSIEQGYFGPGIRVAMGAVLALALVGVGELMRQHEIRLGVAGAASAHIPSILTAAGTTVAYATVYGAFALYGFLSAAAAFALLGAVALATLAAALVHGPALAGLGLIGAYVTPLLVASHEPNYWALYVYLTIVTASALALARARMWRWLAITAIAFSIFWMFVAIAVPGTAAVSAHAFYAVAGFALSALFIVVGLFYGPSNDNDEMDNLSAAALGGYLLGAFVLVLTSEHHLIALAAFSALTVATAAVALRTAAPTLAMVAATTFATLVIVHWATSFQFVAFDYSRYGNLAVVRIEAVNLHLALAAAYAALFGGAAVAAQGRFAQPLVSILWAGCGVLAPIAMLIAVYYRIAEFERSIPFAAIALLMAALYAVTTETLSKREPRPGLAAGTAIIATGAVASLALALTFALERGWLTVGLALMAPGVAFIEQKRPLAILRWVVAAIVLMVLARVAWEPRIVGGDIGTTPIFNWLLYGYGAPAVAFWIAGHLLRKRADDMPSRMTDSAAIMFTVLLFFLEIRHIIYDGDVYHRGTGLAEIAMQISTGLAMTIGLERVRARTRSIIHDAAARLIGTVSFAGIFFGLATTYNPMFTGAPVGGPFFNLILLGYGFPAVLMMILARITRQTRSWNVYVIVAFTAMALALGYLSLEVRTLFHGAVLVGAPTTDAEQYTYSAVWLTFGVALLLVGIALRSQPARLASAAVVILTTAKVFLYDLSGVQGVYRALSFIGLGIVLMGIGYLYQRLLFPPKPPPDATPASPQST